ncbi:serine/threonine-protein kinase [Alcanivorax quisquiliarum]|uniref:Serine/threonine-protein kinase n=1 Tax=Alcanivorax quisquiliarum TaxID=2933565 RepID=A0ABT0E718_9GAMM|nr:serine/threonine-protein kinase [Alcanivorax quisquiliarum]MCK0537624.1 serine/threonine-protein kinase [Alcanivorax quisquiliarum]
MNIHPLSRAELDALARDGKVLEADGHGVKVVALPDGRILKFFRRKRRFNRDLLAPAALRFARHALRLQRLGIPTLRVDSLHRVAGEPHSVAVYQPLAGSTLRELLRDGHASPQLMYRVGAFLALLHRKGVFFRSVHPGNIIVTPQQHFGLIDLLDMKVRPWSMSRWARRRNWLHFLRTPQDRPFLSPALLDAVILGYVDNADLPQRELATVGSHAWGSYQAAGQTASQHSGRPGSGA